jgi:HSP20 family molecular chaperone IbpA
MAIGDRYDWMWGDALEMLARADRLHRQLFQPAAGRARQPSWEPPVDVLETAAEVVIIAALPGAVEAAVKLDIDAGCLLISAERSLPPELASATIHRLELPQGRLERRVPLPPGRFDQIHRRTVNGCLVINLRKAG